MVKKQIKETEFLQKVKKQLQDNCPGRFLIHKSAERWKTGWPDWTILDKRYAIAIFIEAKVGKNACSPLQEHTLNTINSFGVGGYVLRCVKDEVSIIKLSLADQPSFDSVELKDAWVLICKIFGYESIRP